MLHRLLEVGFPKSGKTGSLACLLDAGYTLRYLNFDNNVQPLLAYTTAEGQKRLSVVDCLDEYWFNPATNRLEPKGSPLSTVTAMKALNDWPDGSKAADWGPEDILVVDSGSVMAESAMKRNMGLNGRLMGKPQFADFTAAHDAITGLCLHTKRLLKCHFIMITHLTLIGPDLSVPDFDNDALAEKVVERKLEGSENVPWKLAPKTVGRALHDLAKHFSGVVYATARGPARRLLLRPADGVDAGVPVAGLPPELDIKDGMAKIFLASK